MVSGRVEGEARRERRGEGRAEEVTNGADNGEEAQAGDGILEEIGAAGADEGGALAQAAVVVGGVCPEGGRSQVSSRRGMNCNQGGERGEGMRTRA